MRYREIDWSDITVGMEVTVQHKEPSGSGTGGTVVRINEHSIGLCSGTARIDNVFQRTTLESVVVEEYLDADECLDWRDDGSCRGPVDYRWTGGNSQWPRCEAHWEARMERRENSMERYADSDVVPDWFDPSYAGERWDDD